MFVFSVYVLDEGTFVTENACIPNEYTCPPTFGKKSPLEPLPSQRAQPFGWFQRPSESSGIGALRCRQETRGVLFCQSHRQTSFKRKILDAPAVIHYLHIGCESTSAVRVSLSSPHRFSSFDFAKSSRGGKHLPHTPHVLFFLGFRVCHTLRICVGPRRCYRVGRNDLLRDAGPSSIRMDEHNKIRNDI